MGGVMSAYDVLKLRPQREVPQPADAYFYYANHLEAEVGTLRKEQAVATRKIATHDELLARMAALLGGNPTRAQSAKTVLADWARIR